MGLGVPLSNYESGFQFGASFLLWRATYRGFSDYVSLGGRPSFHWLSRFFPSPWHDDHGVQSCYTAWKISHFPWRISGFGCHRDRLNVSVHSSITIVQTAVFLIDRKSEPVRTTSVYLKHLLWLTRVVIRRMKRVLSLCVHGDGGVKP